MWEKFNNISGNTSYCDSAFFECEYLQRRSIEPPPEEHKAEITEENQKRIDEDASLALAIAMQEKFEQEQKQDIDSQRAIEAIQSDLYTQNPMPPEVPPEVPAVGFAPLPPQSSYTKEKSTVNTYKKKKKKKCLII